MNKDQYKRVLSAWIGASTIVGELEQQLVIARNTKRVLGSLVSEYQDKTCQDQLLEHMTKNKGPWNPQELNTALNLGSANIKPALMVLVKTNKVVFHQGLYTATDQQ